jgi:3-hydroxybutyryl-CoA dehydrogenase
MQLVELIAALQTDKDVLRRAKEFAVDCGKEVVVSQDTPGFISNRLLMPFINEAIIAFETVRRVVACS